MLAENAGAMALLERLGDAEVIDQGGEAEVRIELRDKRGAVGSLHRLLRHAAEETLSSNASFWFRASAPPDG